MRKFRIGRKFHVTLLALAGVTVATLLVLVAGYFLFVRTLVVRAAAQVDPLPLNSWARVEMGDTTKCSDGSEYRIYARRAETDNLIIHFVGGGACWDDETCSEPITLTHLSGYYFPYIWELGHNIADGILSTTNPANPFAEWNVVYIPYCTADFHVGNTTRTFTPASGAPVTINFSGRENATQALDWVYAHFEQPDKLLISGESAGAFGSILWTPTIAAHYSNSEIYQLADGAFLKTPQWRTIVDDVWNADSQANFGFDVGDDIATNGYLHDLEAAPNVTYLHLNTVYDSVLTYFNARLNGVADDAAYREGWSRELRAAMSRIAASGQNYQYFVTDFGMNPQDGTTPHTSISAPLFYDMEQDGVLLRDWLRRIIFEGGRFSVGASLLDEQAAG